MSKTKPNAKAKAKAKSKKDESGIPKKVAGVKVPKAVRESGSLASLFSSALGREILADALIAAAGAAAAALTRSRSAKNAGAALMEAGTDAASSGSEAVQTAAGAVAGVVTEAAKTFLPASLLGKDDADKGAAKGGAASGGQGGGPTNAGDNSVRQRYAHLATDHSTRKTSKKAEKPAKR